MSKGTQKNTSACADCIWVEVDGVKQAKTLNLGDKIEVVLRGTVRSVEQRLDEEDQPYMVVSLSDYVTKLSPSTKNSFTDLVADDD